MHPITLTSLAAFPAQLEAHYAAIPQAFVHWRPASWEGIPSEHYTAIEQICHVRDIEIDGYHARLRRTLAEDHPFLASVDGDELCLQRSYDRADPPTVFTAIRAARAETLAIIASASQAQLRRTAEFEGYGAVTFQGLVHYLCSHDQQHLAGLQWLLGQIDGATAGTTD